VKALSIGVAALVLPLLAVAAPAPPAQAVPAVRWASPSGTSAAPCTEANPCDLKTAVEAAAVHDGDEVIVKPGSYSVTQLELSKAITLHGQAGEAVPTITTNYVPFGVYVGAAATLSDLTLLSSVQTTLLSVAAAGATIERVSATVPFAGGTACNLTATVVLRDSICRATGVNSKGVGSNANLGPGTATITLRNVTALGGFAGLGFDATGPGVVFEIDAKNVLARYAGGVSGSDVRAGASGGASVAITLAHSNYATTSGIGASSSVTAPGTGTNQTAAPNFVDAANGDFHQAPGSPTIDAGVLDAFTGSTDFEGDPRAVRATGGCPALPDIGADEQVTTLECEPPETTIEGASGATEDSTPTFQLISNEPASTFECRVDEGSFAACTSPYTTPVLGLGAHTMAARAIDPSGNVDPTPATRSVTVTAPRAPAEPAPETTLTQAPARKVVTRKSRAKVSFAFSSSASGTFECSLDGAAFTACTSPTKARLRRGKHTFAVRAVTPSGAVDPTPASVTFRVRSRPRR
jgi:hypothetical protein